MKEILNTIAISLALFVFAACAPQPAPAPNDTQAEPASSNTITGIVWNWQSVTQKSSGDSTTVPNPENYTIIFNEDGTTTGQADCNTFSGTYSQESGFSITVQPDVMAACDQGSLDQEYLTLLGDIAAGGPDGSGGLALETAGGAQRMAFSNGGAAP